MTKSKYIRNVATFSRMEWSWEIYILLIFCYIRNTSSFFYWTNVTIDLIKSTVAYFPSIQMANNRLWTWANTLPWCNNSLQFQATRREPPSPTQTGFGRPYPNTHTRSCCTSNALGTKITLRIDQWVMKMLEVHKHKRNGKKELRARDWTQHAID